jgi:hypothetical protein
LINRTTTNTVASERLKHFWKQSNQRYFHNQTSAK